MDQNNTTVKNPLQSVLTLVDQLVEMVLVDSVVLKFMADHPKFPNILKVEGVREMIRLQTEMKEVSQLFDRSIARTHIDIKLEDNTPPEKARETIEEQVAKLRTEATQSIINAAPRSNELGIRDTIQSKLPVPAKPENSISILESTESPLLDIFAGGPCLPLGRGSVLIGAKGFEWYKDKNPYDFKPVDRARLKNGFYGGDRNPAYVILRMQRCILLWDFELNTQTMEVYMVGVSDADPNNIEWKKVSNLSASYAARFVQELRVTKRELA